MKKPATAKAVDDGLRIYQDGKLIAFVPLTEKGKVVHVKQVIDTLHVTEWRDL